MFHTTFLHRVAVSILGAIVAVIANVAPSHADSPARDVVACGSGSTLVGVVRAIAAAEPASAASPTSVSRQNYVVRRSADEVGVKASVSQKAGAVSAPAGILSKTCLYVPSAKKALDVELGATLPGTILGALAAVLAYREGHPWPLGPARADARDTTIMMQSRSGHLFVSITDFKTLQTGGGCSAEEYYRVDLPDYVVRPFDGCIEGHRHPTGMPYLPQLPS